MEVFKNLPSILVIENLEKFFATGFLIFKNSKNFKFILKKFSFLFLFGYHFENLGYFTPVPLFFNVLKNLNLNQNISIKHLLSTLKILCGFQVQESFKKNFNLEILQFFLFDWKQLTGSKKKNLLWTESLHFSLGKDLSEIFFANFPKIEVKIFQQQIFFFLNFIKTESTFFVKNQSFFKEFSFKFLKILSCIELGLYILRFITNFFSQIKKPFKSFFFFRTFFLKTTNMVKKKFLKIGGKKLRRYVEKLSWINKQKKICSWGKKIKIRRCL